MFRGSRSKACHESSKSRVPEGSQKVDVRKVFVASQSVRLNFDVSGAVVNVSLRKGGGLHSPWSVGQEVTSVETSHQRV